MAYFLDIVIPDNAVFLFFSKANVLAKAEQFGLFGTMTPVKGYVNKKTGKPVAPYTGLRRRKLSHPLSGNLFAHAGDEVASSHIQTEKVKKPRKPAAPKPVSPEKLDAFKAKIAHVVAHAKVDAQHAPKQGEVYKKLYLAKLEAIKGIPADLLDEARQNVEGMFKPKTLTAQAAPTESKAAPIGGDMFGDEPEQAQSNQSPHEALRAALKNKNLSAAMAVLQPLSYQDALEALLRSGFSAYANTPKSKKALIKDMEPQLLRASREGKDGFDMRKPESKAAQPAPKSKAAPAAGKQQEYKYAMVNRPLGIGTAPKGYVRAEDRPNKGEPHYDHARHGVLVYDRKLTDQETKQFELAHMAGKNEMSEYADKVADMLGEYAESYLEIANEIPEEFLSEVFDKLKSSVNGHMPSIADRDAFVDMVKTKLQAKVGQDVQAPEGNAAPSLTAEPPQGNGGGNGGGKGNGGSGGNDGGGSDESDENENTPDRISEAELTQRGQRVRQYVDQVNSGTAKHSGLRVGIIGNDAAQRITDALKLPVDGALEVVVANAVIHATNKHPDMTGDDWTRLPKLTNQFDDVAKGRPGIDSKTTRTIIKKVFPDGSGYGAVLEFAGGVRGRRLNLVTYFKGRGKSLEAWWNQNKLGFGSTGIPNFTESSSSEPSSIPKPNTILPPPAPEGKAAPVQAAPEGKAAPAPVAKTPLEFLTEAGLAPEEIAATFSDNPSVWNTEAVRAALADYDDPNKTELRSARRSGPALARLAKIASAQRAWLAAQTASPAPSTVAKTPKQQDQAKELDYASLKTRPDTNPVQQQTGIDAFTALARRVDRLRDRGGSAATLLGSALIRDFKTQGGTALTGKKIQSKEDLAALAQVYRDPRFETFRVVFTDAQGTVVGESAYTSRLPGVVYLPNDMARQIDADAKHWGASNYWMLHNHPGGKSKPSGADQHLTRQTSAVTRTAFKGHIVIDHNEWSHIDENGVVNTTQDPEMNSKNFTETPGMPHDLLGKQLTSYIDVKIAAKTLRENGMTAPVLILTSGLYAKVRLVCALPKGGMSGRRVKAWVRSIGRMVGGGSHAFVILPSKEDVNFPVVRHMLSQGVLTDALDEDGYSVHTGKAGRPIPVPNQDVFERKDRRNVKFTSADTKAPDITKSWPFPKGAKFLFYKAVRA